MIFVGPLVLVAGGPSAVKVKTTGGHQRHMGFIRRPYTSDLELHSVSLPDYIPGFNGIDTHATIPLPSSIARNHFLSSRPDVKGEIQEEDP